jgi:hypothetical protein
VSLSVLSPEIEELKTETQLRSTTGRSTKRASTLNDIILFYLQADHKKKSNMYSFVYHLAADFDITSFTSDSMDTPKTNDS